MRRLGKFLKLPARERALAIRALFHLAAIRISLRLFPLQVIVRRLETRRGVQLNASTRVSSPPSVERIAWAIRAVSRVLPGAQNCLAQALATQAILARQGYASRLCIGVAKDDRAKLTAHAWVECDGAIIIGGAGAAHFTAFPPLEVQRG